MNPVLDLSSLVFNERIDQQYAGIDGVAVVNRDHGGGVIKLFHHHSCVLQLHDLGEWRRILVEDQALSTSLGQDAPATINADRLEDGRTSGLSFSRGDEARQLALSRQFNHSDALSKGWNTNKRCARKNHQPSGTFNHRLAIV